MIDFKDASFIADPYPSLAELRQHPTPVWHEGLGMYLAAKHSHANEVLRHRGLGRIFKPREPEPQWRVFNWLHADSILDSEPPKHTRLRSLITKAFNRAMIERLRPQILEITEALLDDAEQKLQAKGRFDLIQDFAEPLPVKVIAKMLGFPEDDEHLLRPWSQAIVKMYEVSPSDEDKAAARKASQEFSDYVDGLRLERLTRPGEDLISDLAAVEESGEKLNTQELIATCVLLLNAGHEASVNGFGNGMAASLERDDQMQILRQRPLEVAATAVDEFIRFDAPLQLFERTATEPVEIGGVTVEPGQKIASLLGAAARDESVFSNANDMDVTRDPNPHIGFGAGIHFCIGAPLARLEMSISLPMLMQRFPSLELAAEPVRRPTFVLRGYEIIPVTA